MAQQLFEDFTKEVSDGSALKVYNTLDKRNIMIGKVDGIAIDANDSKNIEGSDINFTNDLFRVHSGIIPIDTSYFLYIYIILRTDKVHEYELLQTYQYTPAGHFGVGTGPSIKLKYDEVAGTRAVTKWTELKGDITGLRLTNNSNESHIYDLVVYGVR